MNSKIIAYFSEIELRLLEIPIYKDYEIIRKEILYSEAKIRLKIRLDNDDTVELFEYIFEKSGKLVPSKYSYHWQDKEGTLKKRWDNAPHHKDLVNFPHHIHSDPSHVEPNLSIPNILKILDKIEGQL
jgi:hypothetical protein